MNINDLIAECTVYDFKEMLEEKRPKSWLKSVSAFANGDGGSLFFGVDNDHRVVGLEDVQHVTEAVSCAIKDKMDPLPEVEIVPLVVDDKHLLQLKVKGGKYTPYYYVADGQRMAFVRVGDESVPATSEQMIRLVLKGTNRTYDSVVTDELAKDYSFAMLANTYKERVNQSFEEKYLKSFGLVTEDGHMTNAGLLFTDYCPLKHSRLYCTRWNGNEKDDAINDAEFQSTNILLLLREGMNFIKSNTRRGWVKLPDRRKNKPEYAERAVLEALVNHLIHRDYTVVGGEVHIDIYNNRICITSPGGMYNGKLIQDLDLSEVSSERRNPVIADVMAQLDYMEKRGSGLNKICRETSKLEGYNEADKPTFKSTSTQFTTTIMNVVEGVNEGVSSEQVVTKQEDKNVTYDVTYDNIDDIIAKLAERQRAIVGIIKVRPTVTAGELSRTLHVSERTIRRDISEMPFLKHVGDRNDGHWIIERK